jgi:hypothetical protein
VVKAIQNADIVMDAKELNLEPENPTAEKRQIVLHK